jgi:hypothetical protein
VTRRGARPPGAGRRPGRPAQIHVAASADRAAQYLARKWSPDAIEGLKTAAIAGMSRTWIPVTRRRQIEAAIRRVELLVPNLLLPAVEPLKTAWKELRFARDHDERTRLAVWVLGAARFAGWPEPTATELLAVAILAGCESPQERESRQVNLLKAWTKRHHVARARAKVIVPRGPAPASPQQAAPSTVSPPT